jgi:hypothetical protein
MAASSSDDDVGEEDTELDPTLKGGLALLTPLEDVEEALVEEEDTEDGIDGEEEESTFSALPSGSSLTSLSSLLRFCMREANVADMVGRGAKSSSTSMGTMDDDVPPCSATLLPPLSRGLAAEAVDGGSSTIEDGEGLGSTGAGRILSLRSIAVYQYER